MAVGGGPGSADIHPRRPGHRRSYALQQTERNSGKTRLREADAEPLKKFGGATRTIEQHHDGDRRTRTEEWSRSGGVGRDLWIAGRKHSDMGNTKARDVEREQIDRRRQHELPTIPSAQTSEWSAAKKARVRGKLHEKRHQDQRAGNHRSNDEVARFHGVNSRMHSHEVERVRLRCGFSHGELKELG